MKRIILVIEADEAKYSLLNKYLTELNYAADHIIHCTSLPGALSVAGDNIDIILADLSQHDAGSLSALHLLQQHFVNIPLIILQDSISTHTPTVHNTVQGFLVYGSYDATQLAKAIASAKEQIILRENNSEDYKRYFDNGPIPMWIIDEKTMQFLAVNNAAIAKYGYSRQEFLGMTAKQVRPADDVDAMVKNYNHRTSDYFDAGYWRHLKKSGEVFYVHIYSHATIFKNIPARICFSVDVNDKLLTEQENKILAQQIREQKENLDNILFSINDAIWARNADTMELTYANNAYYNLYGYTPGEVTKTILFDSIYDDDLEKFLASINEVKATGKTEVIYRYKLRDGNIKTLKARATLRKGAYSNQDIISGVTTDISKEKELHDAIRSSEQKLLSTINNTKDLIWSVNPDLEIIFCNKPYQDFICSLSGTLPREGDYVLGDWGSEDFISHRTRDYERALTGETFTTIVEEIFKGEPTYIEISSSPIIEYDGSIIGVNCIARDISQQKKQYFKIREQNEKLREIAWIQSHKVRGPVASILGLASLFDYESVSNEHNRDLLEQIKQVTHELDKVIKEVVDATHDIDQSLWDTDIITSRR